MTLVASIKKVAGDYGKKEVGAGAGGGSGSRKQSAQDADDKKQ